MIISRILSDIRMDGRNWFDEEIWRQNIEIIEMNAMNFKTPSTIYETLLTHLDDTSKYLR